MQLFEALGHALTVARVRPHRDQTPHKELRPRVAHLLVSIFNILHATYSTSHVPPPNKLYISGRIEYFPLSTIQLPLQ